VRKDFYLHKRGSVWYAQFRLPSGEVGSARSSGLANKTAAEKWARAEAEELAVKRTDLTFGEWAKPFFGPDCPHTRRLAEEGRVLSGYSQKIRRGYFERYIQPDKILAAVPLSKLRRADLLTFRSRLITSRGVCRSSQVVMALVRVIVREALFQELIDRDPTTAITIQRYEKKVRKAVDAAALRKVLDPALYDSLIVYQATLLAATTGLRAGEVRALRWEAIDFQAGRLRVERTFRGYSSELGPPKSGKVRTALLPSVIAFPLRLRAFTEGWVFTETRGAPISYRYWAQAFKKAAGDSGLTLHGLRHTLNTLLRDAGEDDEKIRALFGWSGSAIQDNYTHRDLYDLASVSRVIDAIFGGGNGQTGSP